MSVETFVVVSKFEVDEHLDYAKKGACSYRMFEQWAFKSIPDDSLRCYAINRAQELLAS